MENVVKRHLTTPFRRPFSDHNLYAFDTVEKLRHFHQGPLIIDSFCGIGESTLNIAKEHPEALVIGLDKSAQRLNKHNSIGINNNVKNYQLIRADVDDFWRLAVQANWRAYKHYLLYPNPWPKSAHLKRRCHGSPLFPSLIALGGIVELRSNWQTYVQEFAKALSIAGYETSTDIFNVATPITPFERKYNQSNQDLWQCICGITAPVK